jgi:Domain of unknown function (DUF5658)
MKSVRAYPTAVLAIFGSLDCVTTIIGTLFFGTVERNPILSSLVSTNVFGFALVKMTATIFVCLAFIQAEKILLKTKDQASKAFSFTHVLLQIAYAGTIIFLAFVVVNNLLVLSTAI